MNISFSNPERRTQSCAGFTLIELLAIVAVVAVLAGIQMSAMMAATSRAQEVQCASNLKQFGLTLHIYGGEYGDKLPVATSALWAYDLPVNASDKLIRYGMSRNTFYCPANTNQNADGLWNYSSGYRVIGYAMTFPGLQIAASNQNATLFPQSITPGGAYQPPPASARVLIADVTMSGSGQNNPNSKSTYTYTGINGGYSAPGWPGHRTSHLTGKLPRGGNLTMLDGHVEWRVFAEMLPRVDLTSGSPVFWW